LIVLPQRSRTGVSGDRFCPVVGIFDPLVPHKSAKAGNAGFGGSLTPTDYLRINRRFG